MEFPSSAVYGTTDPSSLSAWDGRAESSSYDEIQVASRDDDCVEAILTPVHSPRGGGSSSSAVVVPGGSASGLLQRRRSDLRNALNVGLSWSTSKEESGGEEEEESPESPHIDTAWLADTNDKAQQQQPVVGAANDVVNLSPLLSPSNSLMMDLSDLETSLNDEVSTVKDWLRKVKSERDTLRKEKLELTQQLTNERFLRTEDVSRLQSKLDEQHDELKLVTLQSEQALHEKQQTIHQKQEQHMVELQTLQSQLESSKSKLVSLEEALVKEKSTSTLREANKLEEAHKQHFNQLSTSISELEIKFQADLKEISAQKDDTLEEERNAHNVTRDELKQLRAEKEDIKKELYDMEQELGKVCLEREELERERDDKVSELENVKNELTSLMETHTALQEEVQTTKKEKEQLQLELTSKMARLEDVQQRYNDVQSTHLHEVHSTKEQLKNMCELLETTSKDRDVAQSSLKETKDQLDTLTQAHAQLQNELKTLQQQSQDTIMKQKAEIQVLNEARQIFNKYENESKVEIQRLHKKLEETTGDILRSVQSSNSSDGDGGGCVEGIDESNKVGESKEYPKGKKMMLSLPALVDEASITPTEISIVNEESTSTSIDLLTVTKERDALLREINTSKRERDALRRMVDALKPKREQTVDDNTNNWNSKEEEISDLKMKLIKAEEAYVTIEIEKCEKLGALMTERDGLLREIKTLKASSLSIGGDNKSSAGMIIGGKKEEEGESRVIACTDGTAAASSVVEEKDDIVKALRDQLDTQIKVNERLSKELTMLRDDAVAAKASSSTEPQDKPKPPTDADAEEEEDQDLQEQLEAKIKENEKLSSELMALKSLSTSNDTEAAIQIGKDIEDMKHEHRIEIKLLKKEHAAIKTKVKLLTKEKDELMAAYEVERESNNDLEASLEEMCNLLTAEREVHSERAEEYKIMKKKYSSMKKGETQPGDKTNSDLQEIEHLREANKSLKEKSRHLTKELVESTKAFEETITSYEAVISKVKHAMAEKKHENEKLKNELDETKKALADLETKMGDGKAADGENETQESELNAYREAVDVLKKKLEEAAATIRLLNEDKTKLRLEVSRLKSDFTEVISQFEKELTLSCEASEVALRKKHEECEAAQAALETAKTELMRLRSELANAEGYDQETSQVISDLRVELSQKETDRKALETKLEGAMLKLDRKIENHEEHEKSIHKLHGALNLLESEKAELEIAIAEDAQNHQAEVEELQSKLKGVMQSLEENMELYEQLRSECEAIKEEKENALEENTELSAKVSSLAKSNAEMSVDFAKLKEEKEAVLEKNDELTGKVSVLTGENETFKAQIERQQSSAGFIENQLGSIREEVSAAEEARQKSAKEAEAAKEELRKTTSKLDDLTATNTRQENHINSLHEEMRVTEEARLQVQEDLKTATTELENLRADHLSLKHDMNEQATSMNEVIQSLQSQVKSIESAKEENRQMYERDISLQQAVSGCVIFFQSIC